MDRAGCGGVFYFGGDLDILPLEVVVLLMD